MREIFKVKQNSKGSSFINPLWHTLFHLCEYAFLCICNTFDFQFSIEEIFECRKSINWFCYWCDQPKVVLSDQLMISYGHCDRFARSFHASAVWLMAIWTKTHRNAIFLLLLVVFSGIFGRFDTFSVVTYNVQCVYNGFVYVWTVFDRGDWFEFSLSVNKCNCSSLTITDRSPRTAFSRCFQFY